MTKRHLLLLLAGFTASCTAPVPTGSRTGAANDDLPPAWPRCPEWEKLCGAAKGPDMWLTGRQAVIY